MTATFVILVIVSIVIIGVIAILLTVSSGVGLCRLQLHFTSPEQRTILREFVAGRSMMALIEEDYRTTLVFTRSDYDVVMDLLLELGVVFYD